MADCRVGEATVGDGPVQVSSQVARLTVSDPFVKFTFPMLAIEQGQQTNLVVTIDKNKDFDGTAQAELVGLPNEVTSVPNNSPKNRPN